MFVRLKTENVLVFILFFMRRYLSKRIVDSFQKNLPVVTVVVVFVIILLIFLSRVPLITVTKYVYNTTKLEKEK